MHSGKGLSPFPHCCLALLIVLAQLLQGAADRVALAAQMPILVIFAVVVVTPPPTRPLAFDR